MFAGNRRNGGTALAPAVPDRSAPAFDHHIAITAGLRIKNLLDSDFPALARDRQLGPCLGAVCKVHVRALHLLARISFFKVKIQPDKSKDHGNGLARFISVLRRKGIYRVLVNEGRIGVGQGIESELVIEIVMFQRVQPFGESDCLLVQTCCPQNRVSDFRRRFIVGSN
jgi:hypothetical protein